jgi:hypothetical protein
MSSWNASGLSTHWKKQLPGGSPPAMHWKKQVTSSMQLASSKQPTIWSQQVAWMQSPHSLPSDGQSGFEPQTPPVHSPLQHWSPSLQGKPSCEQEPLHTPPLQVWLQHSAKPTHDAPSGLQGGWQTPPAQSPLQHWSSSAHPAPSPRQGPHSSPQTVATSSTQTSSQPTLQQNASFAQICATHGPHEGWSGAPVVH